MKRLQEVRRAINDRRALKRCLKSYEKSKASIDVSLSRNIIGSFPVEHRRQVCMARQADRGRWVGVVMKRRIGSCGAGEYEIEFVETELYAKNNRLFGGSRAIEMIKLDESAHGYVGQ